MELSKIIDDVFSDFETIEGTLVSDNIKAEMERLLSQFNKRLPISVVYALCKKGLYTIRDIHYDMSKLTVIDVSDILCHMYGAIHIEKLVEADIVGYRWTPRVMYDLHKYSDMIYENACLVYDGGVCDTQKCEVAFDAIKNAVSELQAEHYVYEDEDSVMSEYTALLHESDLDLAVIHGDMTELSQRLKGR